jgi:hypothetical protein
MCRVRGSTSRSSVGVPRCQTENGSDSVPLLVMSAFIRKATRSEQSRTLRRTEPITLFVVKERAATHWVPMAKTSALGLTTAFIVVSSGCSSGTQAVTRPFVAGTGIESGPSSSLWGDGSSGPDGMQIGCIRGRRFAVLITVQNRTKRTVRLLGAETQRLPRVIEPVPAQVSLAPPPPKGDFFVSGLRPWNTHDSSSVAIPPGREGWVQLNFLMRNCDLLRRLESATLNRSVTPPTGWAARRERRCFPYQVRESPSPADRPIPASRSIRSADDRVFVQRGGNRRL